LELKSNKTWKVINTGEETAGNGHLLDLDSSELKYPLKDALEENLQLLSPAKNDFALDDTCLVDFASPKMNTTNSETIDRMDLRNPEKKLIRS